MERIDEEGSLVVEGEQTGVHNNETPHGRINFIKLIDSLRGNPPELLLVLDMMTEEEFEGFHAQILGVTPEQLREMTERNFNKLLDKQGEN